MGSPSSGSAVISPSTPRACVPPSPQTSSSRKQPMSATLRERLRKSKSSFNSYYSVVKRLKADEENQQAFLEKPASLTEANSLKFEGNARCTDKEFEESIGLSGTSRTVSPSESKPVDTGSCSALQNDLVNENLLKQALREEKAKLLKQVEEKEDLLRRLKLVKMYRSKNDLSQLQSLIKKWRSCSQLLLYELQSAMSEEKKLSLTQLIDHYGLDDKLLHYNRNEEEFVDV